MFFKAWVRAKAVMKQRRLTVCALPDRPPDACAGHDEVNVHGVKEHESYRGDRTQASLLAFADNLAPSAGQPHHYIRRGSLFDYL
jgi:hypothetical protein